MFGLQTLEGSPYLAQEDKNPNLLNPVLLQQIPFQLSSFPFSLLQGNSVVGSS